MILPDPNINIAEPGENRHLVNSDIGNRNLNALRSFI